MSLSEIIMDAVKYPFSDYKKFLMVGILSLLGGLSTIALLINPEGDALYSVASIIGMICGWVLTGYGVSVIKKGIEHSNEIPEIDLKKNLIDGIKALILKIVYFIIPIIILLLVIETSSYGALITGLLSSGVSVSSVDLISMLGIPGIIAALIFIVFEILFIIALARFADSGEMGSPFKFSELIEDIKRIGIVNIIAVLIIVAIIMCLAGIVSGLLSYIPYLGILINFIIVGAFTTLFYNKAIGLLYAES